MAGRHLRNPGADVFPIAHRAGYAGLSLAVFASRGLDHSEPGGGHHADHGRGVAAGVCGTDGGALSSGNRDIVSRGASPGAPRNRGGASRSRRMRVLAAFLLVLLPAVAAAGESLHPPFSGDRALKHVQALVRLGPRPPSSSGIQQARAYIHRELRRSYIDVEEVTFG